MFRFSFMIALFAALIITAPSFAQETYTAKDAFVRASPSKTTAAYITITNPSDKADALISAHADWADRVELHNVSKDDAGVMKMFQVESIALPAKGDMVLKPGSFHIMIFGIKDALKENEHKTITLKFENGQTITQDFIIKPMTFQGDAHDGMHDAHKDHGDHGTHDQHNHSGDTHHHGH